MRKRILFILVVIILALVEAGARFAQPWLERNYPAYYFRPFLAQLMDADDTLIWAGRPNAMAELMNTKGEPVSYKLNSQGWRDREFQPFSKPLNALVLGDSFTFGTGVAAESRFTNRMEQRLPNLNIWNLGVMGYAPDHYMLLGQRWITALPWAFVLIQLSNNDLADVAGHHWSRIHSVSGIPAVIEPPSSYLLLSGFSEAWNFLVYLTLLKERMLPEARQKESLDRLLFSLKQNLLLAKERNVPVVFLQATDWGEPVYGAEGAKAYREGVSALAAEFNATLVEAGVGAEDLLPTPDLHWSAAGHEKVSELLLRTLWKPVPAPEKKKRKQ